MKRVSLLIFALCMLVACTSAESKFESEALAQLPITASDFSRYPETSVVENPNVVYKTDSLCIVHLTHSAKNGFGNTITDQKEYIYYKAKDCVCVSFLDLNDDPVYLDVATLESKKVDQIYKNCTYDEAILYRAIVCLNTYGRVVGNKDAKVSLHVPTNTGSWLLQHYTDEFGDSTQNKFLLLSSRGTFSNSATTNSNMFAHLTIDHNNAAIRLVEYDDLVVKDREYCTIKVKDSQGEIYTWKLFNTNSGFILLGAKQRLQLEEMMSKGGELSFHITKGNYVRSDYKFKFDVSGFSEAYKYL